jgi:hypothetical protein
MAKFRYEKIKEIRENAIIEASDVNRVKQLLNQNKAKVIDHTEETHIIIREIKGESKSDE